MACKRQNANDKTKKHVQKVMDEIQEREQKKWIDGRKSREEALKLKATRILRFGRFALRVPSVNITRYHDYPLPESTARPLSKGELDHDKISVKTYIPGQKHYGVMIPELTKPENFLKTESKLAQLKKHIFQNIKHKRANRDNDMFHTDSDVDLTLQDSFGSHEECRPLNKEVRFIVEPKELLIFNSQKQVITKEVPRDDWDEVLNDYPSTGACSTKKDTSESKSVDALLDKKNGSRNMLDEREYIDMKERSIDGEREGTSIKGERNQLPNHTSSRQTCENADMEVITSMSDLTDQ